MKRNRVKESVDYVKWKISRFGCSVGWKLYTTFDRFDPFNDTVCAYECLVDRLEEHTHCIVLRTRWPDGKETQRPGNLVDDAVKRFSL